MSFNDQQDYLDKTINQIDGATKIFPGRALVNIIDEIGDFFEITFGEIGEICELVRQIITKELPIEKFEEALKEKLEEDNQPKVGDIVAEVNEKIFVKLLPVLGLKALPVVIKTATINTANVEIKDEELNIKTLPTPPITTPVIQKTENPTPKTILPPPPRPRPQSNTQSNAENDSKSFTAGIQPQRLSEFTSESSPVSTISKSTYTPSSSQTLNPKSPTILVEPSHESMSDNPMSSFLKMLSSKLSEKELQTRFDKLPFTLKTALRSIDSARTVVDIGRKHALHVDKIGTLGEETGMVILGITHPAQFPERLANNLGLNDELTRQIAQEINAEIFLKIREALKQVNGEGRNIVGAKPLNTPQQTPQMNYPTQSQHPQSGVITNEGQNEQLNREKILKEIENPAHVNPDPLFERDGTQKKVTTDAPKKETPPPVPENLPVESEIPTIISNVISQETVAPKPEIINNSADQPAIKPATSIIDKKLSEKTSVLKSESSYKVDPYREPIG